MKYIIKLAELKGIFDRFSIDECLSPPETCQVSAGRSTQAIALMRVNNDRPCVRLASLLPEKTLLNIYVIESIWGRGGVSISMNF